MQFADGAAGIAARRRALLAFHVTSSSAVAIGDHHV
jgi:hypothetical protein